MIHLKLSSPKGVLLDEDVVSVLLPSYNGPMMVEEGLTNMIVAFSDAGVLKVASSSSTRYFAIFYGEAYIEKGGDVHVIAEGIEDGYSIDLARAIAKRDRNLDLIQNKKEGDIKKLQFSLKKQLARIEAKQLSEGKR